MEPRALKLRAYARSFSKTAGPKPIYRFRYGWWFLRAGDEISWLTYTKSVLDEANNGTLVEVTSFVEGTSNETEYAVPFHGLHLGC